jgi:hypothetical protein
MEVFMDAMRNIHERDEAVYQLISPQLKEMIMPTNNPVQACLDAVRLAADAVNTAAGAAYVVGGADEADELYVALLDAARSVAETVEDVEYAALVADRTIKGNDSC